MHFTHRRAPQTLLRVWFQSLSFSCLLSSLFLHLLTLTTWQEKPGRRKLVGGDLCTPQRAIKGEVPNELLKTGTLKNRDGEIILDPRWAQVLCTGGKGVSQRKRRWRQKSEEKDI